MDLHSLKPKTKRHDAKRIGRGGKRGTTSGRGTKGQKSRAGHRIRPAIRDLMMKIPKLRGFKFKGLHDSFVTVDLNILENNFGNGEKVTPRTLKTKGLVVYGRGSAPKIKVLDKGRLTKKLILENLSVSQKAASKILAVGGEVRQSQ
ncbi:MAG: 50S ribosomal protein L15 [Parcubacteria group bacterium]|nr:50S ribosomal protein L15 [Parcubacteria group bacterium]